MTRNPHPMNGPRIGQRQLAFAALGLTLILVGGCAADSSATNVPTVTERPTEADATESAQATAEPTASETPAALALPDDLTLEPDGTSTVSGEAHFAAEGSDEVAITVTLQGAEDLLFGAFHLLVLPGTCDELSEPADWDPALDDRNVTLGEEAESPVVVALDEILGSPHLVLVTNAPGDHNLACGEIEG